MKNFLEYQMNDFKILAERKTDEGTEQDVEVKWQHADIVNNNNRRYRRKLLEREINRIQKEIEAGKTVWGHSYHPADGVGRAEDISHKWKKVWMEDDGACKGVLTLVPTVAGKNMQALVKVGRIGISSRGFGTTTERRGIVDGKSTKFLDVNDDYKMQTPGDFVVSPSVAGAGNINEELTELEDRLNKSDAPGKKDEIQIDEGFIDDVLQMNYSTAVDEYGYNKGLDTYKKEHRALTTAAYLVQEGHFESTEQALEYLGESELAKRISSEPKQERVTARQIFAEAMVAGIDPKVYAERVNKQVEVREQLEADADFSTKEVACILREASSAGVNVYDPDTRKEVLEKARSLRRTHRPRPATVEERAGAIVQEFKSRGEEVKMDTVKAVIREEDEKRARAKKIASNIREQMLAGKIIKPNKE